MNIEAIGDLAGLFIGCMTLLAVILFVVTFIVVEVHRYFPTAIVTTTGEG